MNINGKERHFLLTVDAAEKIGAFCPNGDFNQFMKITEGKTFSDIVDMDLKIAEILINEYEQNKAIETAGYIPEPVDLSSMNKSSITPFWIRNLEKEMVTTIQRDAFGQIETEETKEGKKAKKNSVGAETKA